MEINNKLFNAEKSFIDLNSISVKVSEFRFLTVDIMRKHSFIPLESDKNYVYIAMKNPEDLISVEKISVLIGRQVYAVPAAEEQIYSLINIFEDMQSTTLILEQLKKQEEDEIHKRMSSESVNMVVETSPAVRVSNSMIVQAVNKRASDIHIEPFETLAVIRYRIDGVLQDIFEMPISLYQSVCGRIKLEAKMDIAEKRIPQDGKYKFNNKNIKVDLRISTLPTIYGEKIVIRILYRNEKLLSLNSLGFSDESVDVIKSSLNSGYGIIIVTGPTGSGKTTTLYSMLNELDRYNKNIVSIEDPVEIFFDRVNQINVNYKSGLTFANGLRSILRQDPDVIMIGEIRDADTAHIAIQAAITGHLVLTTLHTNDAASSITRLMDMGVPPYLLADSLIACIAQRLVRKICSFCKTSYAASENENTRLNINSSAHLYKGKGCIFCGHTGYKQRTAVYEVMSVNSELRGLINKGKSAMDIRSFNKKAGMKTIQQNGYELVRQGVTTHEEFIRLTNDNW
ncbi:GspE/PulE family protein [Clostridium swellfunianum]|uniref:GspE/PulE family protein n=1 Tax=Clostridium swellfunianum TaxID=1367462 RepID=UPI002030D29A|nr:GspE/PulE family protein [Clostridium swellfunianum]MCM0650391.1 GspE/PulE family protein [Clostridium swellfunianum]